MANTQKDKLKPKVLKYVKAFDFLTYVVHIKRRLICHDCKYKFTEPVTIQRENKNISNKVKQKFLIDLKHHATHKDVEKQLINWISLVREQNVVEMNETANTIENWLEYICNSFIDKTFSNGFTVFLRLRLLYILNNKNMKKPKK